jgi:hypothetical protein
MPAATARAGNDVAWPVVIARIVTVTSTAIP